MIAKARKSVSTMSFHSGQGLQKKVTISEDVDLAETHHPTFYEEPMTLIHKKSESFNGSDYRYQLDREARAKLAKARKSVSVLSFHS